MSKRMQTLAPSAISVGQQVSPGSGCSHPNSGKNGVSKVTMSACRMIRSGRSWRGGAGAGSYSTSARIS
jgi:hypothetical protein